MTDYSLIKYRTVLSDDGKYAEIYSSKGKLMSYFYLTIEDGYAVLRDKIQGSMSVIPTYDDVMDIQPFEYNKTTDVISFSLMLSDGNGVRFATPVSELMYTKTFPMVGGYSHHHCGHDHIHEDFCHHDKPSKLDRYAYLDELLYETKMRKRGDEEIKEMLDVAEREQDMVKEKVIGLESALSVNTKRDGDRDRRMSILSDTTEKIRTHVLESLSDFKKDLNEETENRITSVNDIYNSYISVKGQVDRCTDKVNEAHETASRLFRRIDDEHNHIKDVERKLSDEVSRERIERHKSDTEIMDRFMCKFQEKGNYVELKKVEGKNYITLPSKTSIISKTLEGATSTVIDVSDKQLSIGSESLKLNLLGKNDILSYNGNDLALKNDVSDAIEGIKVSIDDSNESLKQKLFELEHKLEHYQRDVNTQLSQMGEWMINMQSKYDELSAKVNNG